MLVSVAVSLKSEVADEPFEKFQMLMPAVNQIAYSNDRPNVKGIGGEVARPLLSVSKV